MMSFLKSPNVKKSGLAEQISALEDELKSSSTYYREKDDLESSIYIYTKLMEEKHASLEELEARYDDILSEFEQLVSDENIAVAIADLQIAKIEFQVSSNNSSYGESLKLSKEKFETLVAMRITKDESCLIFSHYLTMLRDFRRTVESYKNKIIELTYRQGELLQKTENILPRTMYDEKIHLKEDLKLKLQKMQIDKETKPDYKQEDIRFVNGR